MMKFHKVNAILEHIASDNSRKHKEAVLKANSDNEDLKTALHLALSPFKQFYIKKIPEYQNDPGIGGIPLSQAMSMLDELHERTVTGHAAVEYLRNILETVEQDDAKVIEKIIQKDLRAGISESTVNKIFKKLVPTYPCLLGKEYKKEEQGKIEKYLSFPAISQIKADGTRINIHVDLEKQVVSFFTRSGRPVELYNVHDRYFLGLAQFVGYSCVFDGELLMRSSKGFMNRKAGNGYVTKAIRGTLLEKDAYNIYAQLWDVIPLKDFWKYKYKKPYQDRLRELQTAIDKANITRDVKPFGIIETRVVNSWEEVEEYFQESLSRGEEGIMLKSMNSPWEDKRTYNLIKFKSEKECDLEVIGWNEGKGKNSDTFGSLQCASSDRKVIVDVSGFSDDLRKEISDNMENYIGKIITVRYNERIASKIREDLDSLFLPRFVEFRDDKDVANSSEDIV